MDGLWVVLGLCSLGIGIIWTRGLLADRGRPPAQRRNFKGPLTGPTLAAVLWLLLGVWWLARGLLD